MSIYVYVPLSKFLISVVKRPFVTSIYSNYISTNRYMVIDIDSDMFVFRRVDDTQTPTVRVRHDSEPPNRLRETGPRHVPSDLSQSDSDTLNSVLFLWVPDVPVTVFRVAFGETEPLLNLVETGGHSGYSLS